MKKTYRAHPLMIFTYLKPFLFFLALPVAKAILQYFIQDRVINILDVEIGIFVFILIVAILKCACFKVICDDETVIIKKGFILVNEAKIDISKLSSVQTVRNPIDAIFGAMTFRINTEAGKKDRSDFQFKLRFSAGKELARRLYGGETVSKQRFSAIKVALMAAATSSAFTGIIIGVPILNRAGNLLGIALSDMLLDEISNLSAKIETHFPPVVNTVSLVFLLSYLVSFVYSFCKFLNFRVILGDNKLEIRSGLFSLVRTSFKRTSVNNVKIEQKPLMRALKRYSLKVSVGGFGEAKSESQVMVPAGKYDEIHNDFALYFPFLTPEGNVLQAKRSKLTEGRFLFLPAIYLLIVLASSIILALYFTEFTRFILFLTLVALCIVFYFAYVCVFEYKFSNARLGKNIFAQGVKGLRTCELYCPAERVGEIKLTRFFMDFYYKTCRLRVTVCSESADSIKVRFLDYETTKKEIFECFSISEL